MVCALVLSSQVFTVGSALAQTKKTAAAKATGQSGFKKYNGIEYKVLKSGKGLKANTGDYIDVSIVIRLTNYKTKDTIIAESEKLNAGKPVTLQMKGGKPYDWTTALVKMSKGDSAVLRVAVDTLKQAFNQQMPPFMESGDFVEYIVKVYDVKSAAAYQLETQQHAKARVGEEDKAIQKYLTDHNLKAEKTKSGLYYIITKDGVGDKIAKGETAKVNYTGKLMDGTVFDSNTDPQFQHVEPLPVKVGTGSVIPGWDEGLALLKRNSTATFLIPSGLAYGERAMGKIPANAILIFDVDIVDVTSGN